MTNKEIVRKLLRIKQDCERQKKKANEAKGAYDQIMSRAKDEFGTDTIEAMKKKIRTLTVKETTLRKKLEERIKTFESEWKDRVETE